MAVLAYGYSQNGELEIKLEKNHSIENNIETKYGGTCLQSKYLEG
jgi:hypothetical protein